MLRRLGILALGSVAVLLYHAFILYFVAFLSDLSWLGVVPQGIDSPSAEGPARLAVLVDLGLVSLFALHHSVAARPWFKEWVTGHLPAAAERALYVLCAALLMFVLFWQWRPIDVPIWTVEATAPRLALWALFGGGLALLGVSESAIDRGHLLGIKQAWAAWRQTGPVESPDFQTPGPYRYVRHPMMTGLIIALWATPHMTVGHALFAGSMTAYVLVGIWFEEQALLEAFGDAYRQYRRETPALVPLPFGG